MNIAKAMELLTEKSDEVQGLSALPYTNTQYRVRCYAKIDILQAAFGSDSDELKRFQATIRSRGMRGSAKQLQQIYQQRPGNSDAAILSIVQKHQLQGRDLAPSGSPNLLPQQLSLRWMKKPGRRYSASLSNSRWNSRGFKGCNLAQFTVKTERSSS